MSDINSDDYYKVLGVSRNAEDNEINRYPLPYTLVCNAYQITFGIGKTLRLVFNLSSLQCVF